MELKQMMNDAFDKIQESGFVEQTIEARIQETLKSIINDLFRDYSDFGKSLKEQLSKKVAVNLGNIDLPAYNVMIENYIKQQTTQLMNEEYAKLTQDRLSEILKKEEKREWKLSEIIEKIVEENSEEQHENQFEKLSLHFDNWHKDFWHIRIDPEEGKDKYQCCIDIDIGDGKITHAKIGEYNTKDFKKEKFVRLYGVEALIFRLFSQGCSVEVDQDECKDRSYYPNPYDY